MITIYNHLSSRLLYRISCVLFLAIMITPSASAAVTDFQITPGNPVPGDTITITGNASPDESINAVVSFTKIVTATGGQYEYNVGSVEIPSGPNRFTVVANTVAELHISVNLFGVPLPLTISKDSVGGTATISQSGVPAGTHKIKIGGLADNGATVNLLISAEQTITADQNGNFEYSASTSSIPVGDFTIEVGGLTKTVYLGTAQSDDSDQNTGFRGSFPNTDIVESVVYKESEQNVILTESHSKKVQKGTMVTCEFNRSSNPLKLINFTSDRYYYNVLIQADVLQSISSLVKTPPSNSVYMNINIWIGNTEFTTPINDVDATIDFTVDKDWIENNNINASTIAMLHYNTLTDLWEALPTEQIGNRGNDVLYHAFASDFSPFAIVGDENKLAIPIVSKTENTTFTPENPVNGATPTTTKAPITESTTITQNIWMVLFAVIIIVIIFLTRKKI